MRAVLLIGLTAGMLAAAPVPKGAAEKPRAWKPKAGTRMVHAFGTTEMERTIEDVSARADAYSFSIAGGQRAGVWRLRVGATATTNVSDPNGPGVEVGYYRPGLKVGDAFDAPGEVGRPGAMSAHAVEAEEEVTVPAGKYKALRIRVASGNDFRTYWLNYEVGVVRITSATGAAMMELKSYTPGQ